MDESYFSERGGLDPNPGPPISFALSGLRCFLGNRPTRLALEIAENDNGEIEFTDRDPATWDIVDQEAA